MPEWNEEKQRLEDWLGQDATMSPARQAEGRRYSDFKSQMWKLGYPSKTPGAEPSPAGKAASQLLSDYFTNAGLAPDYLAKSQAESVARIGGEALVGAHVGSARERARGYVRGAEIGAETEGLSRSALAAPPSSGSIFGEEYKRDLMAIANQRVRTAAEGKKKKRETARLLPSVWDELPEEDDFGLGLPAYRRWRR